MPRVFILRRIACAILVALALGTAARAGEERAIVRLLEAIAGESRMGRAEVEALLVERYNARLGEGLRGRASRELGASLDEARTMTELERLAPRVQSLVAAELAEDGVIAARAGIEASRLRTYAGARQAFLAEGVRGNLVSEELARQALSNDAAFLESTGRPLLGEGCGSLGDAEAMRTLRDLSDGMAARARGLGPGASPQELDEALEGAAREALGERSGRIWEDRLCRLILVCRVFDGSFGKTRCP